MNYIQILLFVIYIWDVFYNKKEYLFHINIFISLLLDIFYGRGKKKHPVESFLNFMRFKRYKNLTKGLKNT